MLLREHEKKNLVLSGAFILALSSITMFIIFILGKDLSIFDTKGNIYSYVKNAKDLKVGTKVKLKGIKIGKIHSINIQELNKIQIQINLSAKYLKWIKSDSFISIKTQGVLGDKFLEISGGTDGSETLIDQGTIKVKEDSKFDIIINKGEDIAFVLARVVNKLDKILGSISDNNISKILKNIEVTTQNTTNLTNQFNEMNLQKISSNIEQSTSEMSAILKNFDLINKHIKNGPGTLHSLIYDKDLYEDLKILLGGANRNKVLKYFIRESIKNE